MVNKEFIVAGVRNLMFTNYGVEKDSLNVEDLVDSSLSMDENWAVIKPKVLVLCRKNNKSLF